MTAAIAPVLHRAPRELSPAELVSGTAGRLVVPGVEDGGWGLDSERALGCFGPPVDRDDFLTELEISGLRGRGGAGFPAFRKWTTVSNAPGESVVVANGHEGEPASSKDRWLLTRRPHLVLDGLLLAAQVTGSSEAVVYVSHSDSVASMQRAISEIESSGLVPAGLTLHIHQSEPTYVAGEASAVCRSINGGPALPTSKPPRPAEAGVHGLPTLVTNVETLAHAAWIRIYGGAQFASVGSDSSKGTALFTLNGFCERPGVYEMSLGATIADLIAAGGGASGDVTGLMIGGWFGGILGPEMSSLHCCYDAIQVSSGSGLGCAAVTVLGPEDDIIATSAALAAWYQAESAKQCGVCVSGTGAIARTLRQITRGEIAEDSTENLMRWGATLGGRGACGFIDGASALARTAGLEMTRRDSAQNGV